jgi:hypothetical protein
MLAVKGRNALEEAARGNFGGAFTARLKTCVG